MAPLPKTFSGVTDWTQSPIKGGDGKAELRSKGSPISWICMAEGCTATWARREVLDSAGVPCLLSDLLFTRSPSPLAPVSQDAHPRPGSWPHPPPSDQCPHYCLFYDLFKESSFQRTAGKELRKGRGRWRHTECIPCTPLLPFKIVIKRTYIINEKPTWCRKPSPPPHLSSLQMYPYVCLILIVLVISSMSLSNTLYFYILIY